MQVILWGLIDVKHDILRGSGMEWDTIRRWRRDESKLRMSPEEEEVVDSIGIGGYKALEVWAMIRSGSLEVGRGIGVAKRGLRGRRREEYRKLHSERTKRIEECADCGKVGGVIRKVLGPKKMGFKMEQLVEEGGNVTDPAEITKRTSAFLSEWF